MTKAILKVALGSHTICCSQAAAICQLHRWYHRMRVFRSFVHYCNNICLLLIVWHAAISFAQAAATRAEDNKIKMILLLIGEYCNQLQGSSSK